MKRFLLLVALAASFTTACQQPEVEPEAEAKIAICTDRAACVDRAKIKDGPCPTNVAPVCGCDGKTYLNSCLAGNAGVQSYSQGACPSKAQ